MYNEEIISDVREGNICLFGHCNAGKTYTSNNVRFGSIQSWINKEGISSILSIQKLEEMGFRITYDSMDRHNIVHTNDGEVQFNKYEIGLPDIDTKKTGRGLHTESPG